MKTNQNLIYSVILKTDGKGFAYRSLRKMDESTAHTTTESAPSGVTRMASVKAYLYILSVSSVAIAMVLRIGGSRYKVENLADDHCRQDLISTTIVKVASDYLLKVIPVHHLVQRVKRDRFSTLFQTTTTRTSVSLDQDPKLTWDF